MSNTNTNATKITQSSAFRRWLATPYSRPEAEATLLLLPHAGGGPAWYAAWGDLLPPEIELKVLHMPGRGSRHAESAETDFENLISILMKELVPMLDAPFSMFGHSLGALVAFELARALGRTGGKQPRQLFVSGCPSPQLVQNRIPISDLPEDAFVEEVRLLGGSPLEILDNGELLRLALPSLRSDMVLFESYVLRDDTTLECPVFAFGGSDDRMADRNELEGWGAYTSAGCVVRVFDGDHFFVREYRGEIVRIIAEEILHK